ncbi:tripartite tricarboxylate transporter permease [Alkalihalobacterium alkalinitrilicum]|uniref:tripartite tricarboxylate transporter permease n=1 Tax=Alkalihalobacterium alkalinitrilicum TaxID=427920 RepID=UPI00099573C1|nr:tripartite tricarboxylate transporter permease [Alkalihalobacterium alkalinitrilicum]
MGADILAGLEMMFQPHHVLLVFLGVVLGTVMGAIPGLSSTMGIALLLPITFTLSPVAAIAMLTAMYKGGLFGGSIASILFNAPGTSAAAATGIDGYQLTKQGKSGKAIRMALIGSSVGDLIGCITLILLAGLIAKAALMFGPPEYVAIILFAFTMVLGVADKALMKGFLALGIGILISTVGYDPVTGVPRFEFGSMEMSSGFSLIAVLIGLLALPEVFRQIEDVIREKIKDHKGKKEKAEQKVDVQLGDSKLTWKEVKGTRKVLFTSAGVGTFIGALPGLGPTIAAFMGYRTGKKISKDPNYGKGSLHGVAAPEAANSAVASANLIPLLALGIPGDVEAALILGALTIQGITPGPQIFVNNGAIVYGIYAGMIMAIIMNFVFNWYFVRGVIKVKNISIQIMVPIIMVLCIAGTFGYNQNMFDVKVMFAFGLLGYILNKFGIPTTALLIGFILTPIFERSLRQTLALSDNGLLFFFERPIALVFIAITLVTVVSYFIKSRAENNGKSVSQ